jgi:hypothetical protein
MTSSSQLLGYVKIENTEGKRTDNEASSINNDASYCSLNSADASTTTSCYCSMVICINDSDSSFVESENDRDSHQPASADVNYYSTTNATDDKYSRNQASSDAAEADASLSRSNSVAVAGADTYSKLTTSTDSARAEIIEASHYETRISLATQVIS